MNEVFIVEKIEVEEKLLERLRVLGLRENNIVEKYKIVGDVEVLVIGGRKVGISKKILKKIKLKKVN